MERTPRQKPTELTYTEQTHLIDICRTFHQYRIHITFFTSARKLLWDRLYYRSQNKPQQIHNNHIHTSYFLRPSESETGDEQVKIFQKTYKHLGTAHHATE